MGENSWIIDNLNAALNTWNEKLAEIWQLLTQGLADFKGGGAKWNNPCDLRRNSIPCTDHSQRNRTNRQQMEETNHDRKTCLW